MKNALWFAEAMKDLGLKEIGGERDNPRVVEMFAQSGHPWVNDDETAWCAAAVGAWLKQAGYVGTGSLAARSYLKWGKSLNKKVVPGAIAVFKRGNSSWQGHVAICTGKETRTHMQVLGGNQRNAVNMRMYPKNKLLDTRWPSVPSNSRTIKAQIATLSSGSAAAISETVTTYLPIAQDTAQYFDWAKYAAFGIAMIGAMATILYRIQDQKEKGR